MIIEEINFIDPERIFNAFVNEPGSLWLDSSINTHKMGGCSFLAISPYNTWSLKNSILTAMDGKQIECNDPFKLLQEEMAQLQTEHIDEIPNFQTGVAGLFSYNLHSYIEPIKSGSIQGDPFPDLYLGFYDLVIAYEHNTKRTFIFSSGAPKNTKNEKDKHAHQRLKWLLDELKYLALLPKVNNTPCSDFSSSTTKEQYIADTQTMIDYIYAGDIFEANLSQEFTCKRPSGLSSFDLYRRLRKYNPAPFSAMLNMNGQQILSSSPERFLHLENNIVESRPIKGTMPRSDDPILDQQYADRLLASEKDHAENTMIVDLMRNDISRVCTPGSVNVPQLCALESYKSVHHLVSVVLGKLQTNHNHLDLLKCCFPGGSITGAPKIRAMEIIYELEKVTRGPYYGSMLYISNSGAMDSSILIRTILCDKNNLSLRAGGAIVVDSEPDAEYEETLTKAIKLKEALLAL
ncbi:MAG: anthranilate synthase component I family protein [Francisellaceae bacterium]|jgi:para-aminobenzoate synthetase component I|nr:anthranilate synthase component I family protein [Francisellaceae bacterium]